MSTNEKSSSDTQQRHHPAAENSGDKFRKYSFDNDFFEVDVDDNAAVAHALGAATVSTAHDTEAEPAPKGPTQEDLAQAESRGYSAGLADGKAQAEEHVQQLVATHLQPLVEQLAALEAAREEYLQLAGSQSLSLLRHLLKKFLQDAANRYPETLLKQSLSEALQHIVGDVPLRMTVHPATRDTLTALLKKDAQFKKMGDNIRLESSTTLQPGDCRIEWATGGLDARLTTALREVDKLLGAAQAEALQKSVLPPKKEAAATPAPEEAAPPAAENDTPTDEKGE